MTFEQFLIELWDEINKLPKQWRFGQKVFNAVNRLYGVARDIQFNEGIDCFYNDGEIGKFIAKTWSKINENI